MPKNADELEIDNMEYAVLKAFHKLDRPLWKQRVQQFIEENHHDMPIDGSVSIQTVSRRIDRLKYERYLESTIISPDDAPRGQIIAFTLTGKGKDALESFRINLLKQVLMNHLFPNNGNRKLSKKAIICLMDDQYGFSKGVKEQLFDYDRDSILAFLLIRYAQKEAVEILDKGIMSDYHDVLNEHPDVKQELKIQ